MKKPSIPAIECKETSACQTGVDSAGDDRLRKHGQIFGQELFRMCDEKKAEQPKAILPLVAESPGKVLAHTLTQSRKRSDEVSINPWGYICRLAS